MSPSILPWFDRRNSRAIARQSLRSQPSGKYVPKRIERLKLYHYPASRSARVKWMLHEVVGDALEVAMVAFLADAYPEKGLAPLSGASPARIDYLQMLHFGSTWMDMMRWQVRIHEHVLPNSERDPRTIARYRRKFTNEVEPQLARRLDAAPYVCGDVFTAADCVVGHSVAWARATGCAATNSSGDTCRCCRNSRRSRVLLPMRASSRRKCRRTNQWSRTLRGRRGGHDLPRM